MCGDLCPSFVGSCTCGNVPLTRFNTQHYCCLPPESYCSMDDDGNVDCSAGQVMHKSELCNGECPKINNITHSISISDDNLSCGFTDTCDYDNFMSALIAHIVAHTYHLLM